MIYLSKRELVYLFKLLQFFILKAFSLIILSACSSLNNEENLINKPYLPSILNKLNPHIIWSVSVGHGLSDFYSNLHPVYLDGIIYAADRAGVVKAINAEDGREIWTINLAKEDNWFSTIPVLFSGGISASSKYIYIGSEKAQIYALNTIDGTLAWQARVAGEVLSCPVVKDGVVLVHTSNGYLQALNETDGLLKWTTSLGVSRFSLRGESTPAIVSGIAIVGSDNGYINAISMQNGQIIWQQRISKIMGPTEIDCLNDIDTTPIVVNSVVYTLSYNGSLAALDLHNGEIIWKREFSSVNDFVIYENYIYLVDQDNQLLAINIKNGAILWKQSNLLHNMLTAPIIHNTSLVVSDHKGYIYLIDPQNGSFLARKKIDDSGFINKPIIADDKLIIQAKNGTLYAIKYNLNNFQNKN